MVFNNKPYTADRIVRICITIILFGGFVWLLNYLSDVLIPFAVAFLLAYLINPLVLLLQKKIPNRFAAVFISLFIVLAGITVLAWLFIPIIMNEIIHTGNVLTAVFYNSELAERAGQYMPKDIWQTVKDYVEKNELQDSFKRANLGKIIATIARKVLPGIWGVITGTASFVIGLIGLSIIGLYLIFLLLDYQKIRQNWKSLLPPAYRETIPAFIIEFESAMKVYFRGQAAVATIVGILYSLGFWIINLPLGILLGLFIGLLNMVPYLQVIGFIPAFLLGFIHALETGGNLWLMFGLICLVFVIVQVIQDGILVPKIMGSVTGLSPAIILLSLSIWGKLLGIFGLLIAIPVTCLFFAYYRRLVM